jgi:type II secretion system protein E
MTLKSNILIGQMLIDAGVITQEQLEAGLKTQKKPGSFICTTLVKLGLVKEEEAFPVLSKQLNIPYVNLKELEISPELINKVPAKFASHYKFIPIALKENKLTIAVTDPLDTRLLDDIRLLLNLEVQASLSGEQSILEAIQKFYGIGAETLEKMVEEKTASGELSQAFKTAEDLEALSEDASIINFVNQILLQAIQERATDIHLEPFEDELKVRFRIDGVLYDTNVPLTIKYFHPAIVSRIKIMAGLNIVERRLSQDGRIKVKVADNELDLRVSIIPSGFGEAAHIRLLSPIFLLDLEKLGLLPQDLKIIESVIKKPHGIIFITGPTGSGKSTTLYACLSKINSPEVKIITIEDPIEYQLRGVMQIQVMPQIGLTFATGLRSMLRHDPDVMMVGEVRDYETAEIAIRAALTGHLVFSTLHTNDACGAATRLLDMGVEAFLTSSSLECVIAQRLVRLICLDCKTTIQPKKEALEQLGPLDIDFSKVTLFEGKGCEKCKFTGYRGRTGIYEILLITEPIRDLILKRTSSQEIKKKAISLGMRTLRQDGLEKVLKGLTTVSEILRVTQQE